MRDKIEAALRVVNSIMCDFSLCEADEHPRIYIWASRAYQLLREALQSTEDDSEPITAQWCIENGATLIDKGECGWDVSGGVRVVWAQYAECVGVDAGDHGIVALSITTRDRLRNLLAALWEDVS